MPRKGLFGGSFDPVHKGHIALAETLATALSLDCVVLMPSAQPPHKIKTGSASAADRLAMCRLAAAENPLIEVSDFELRRGGASFTVDTLTALAADEPETEWYLLCGADMFLTLATWKRFDEIARIATLCAVPRDAAGLAELNAYADRLRTLGARCEVVVMPLYPVSSTAIRQSLLHGDADWQEAVPPTVAAYIEQHRLYCVEVAPLNRDEQYRDIIRERLSAQRYRHSLAVADEARRLARRYGADEAQAYTAGLLHDILKDTDGKAQLQILSDFGIMLSNVEQQAPKLWHAMAGAAFIEHILGVTDREIIAAVRYHTTARADMCLLEKVLYLADFTSADRDYDDVDEMRRRVDIDIPCAMEYALRYSIKDLLKKRAAVHPDTVAAYNEIVLERTDV